MGPASWAEGAAYYLVSLYRHSRPWAIGPKSCIESSILFVRLCGAAVLGSWLAVAPVAAAGRPVRLVLFCASGLALGAGQSC